MGSGYQSEPSRATLNDLSYRDLARPPGTVVVSGIRQLTSSTLKHCLATGRSPKRRDTVAIFAALIFIIENGRVSQ